MRQMSGFEGQVQSIRPTLYLQANEIRRQSPTSPSYELQTTILSSDRPADTFFNFARITQENTPIFLIINFLVLIICDQPLNFNPHRQSFKHCSLF